MGSRRCGLSSPPPPRRLFVTERRPECGAKARGGTRTTRGAEDYQTPGVRDL